MKWIKRGVLLLLAFLFFPTIVRAAAPAAPTLLQTDWRTGELEIKYDNAVPGNLMELYAATYKDPDNYQLIDIWVAGAASESHITQYLENGQTIWYYVVQRNPYTGEVSPKSNVAKQTPPTTVYVINWPDMFRDLSSLFQNLADKIQQLNDDMKKHLDDLFTPSDQARADLQDAVDGLKNAVGGNQASDAADGLINGINNAQSGMSAPLQDDGIGTFTGGKTGNSLPFPSQSTGSGLVVPDLDSGTDTEITMRIPIGIKPDGSLFYIKLFTQEQMEKMKWLGLIRTIAGAIIWIMFGIWLVVRFTPQLKA